MPTKPKPNSGLQIRDLSVHFFTYSGVVKAVNHVNLDVAPGQMSALVGESGSGKSVIGWAALGMIKRPGRAVGGEILWNGENVLSAPEARLAEIRGKEISLIVSNPRSHLHQMIKVGPQIQAVYNGSGSKKELRQVVLEALRSVEMPDPARVYDSYPFELSGGMAQRVIIAMSLVNSPRLVIADDATSALDVTVQRQVLDMMIKRVRDHGSAALLITHDLGVVAQYCQNVNIIFGGTIVEQGSAREIFMNPQHPYTKKLLSNSRRAFVEQDARAVAVYRSGSM